MNKLYFPATTTSVPEMSYYCMRFLKQDWNTYTINCLAQDMQRLTVDYICHKVAVWCRQTYDLWMPQSKKVTFSCTSSWSFINTDSFIMIESVVRKQTFHDNYHRTFFFLTHYYYYNLSLMEDICALMLVCGSTVNLHIKIDTWHLLKLLKEKVDSHDNDHITMYSVLTGQGTPHPLYITMPQSRSNIPTNFQNLK